MADFDSILCGAYQSIADGQILFGSGGVPLYEDMKFVGMISAYIGYAVESSQDVDVLAKISGSSGSCGYYHSSRIKTPDVFVYFNHDRYYRTFNLKQIDEQGGDSSISLYFNAIGSLASTSDPVYVTPAFMSSQETVNIPIIPGGRHGELATTSDPGVRINFTHDGQHYDYELLNQ